MLLALSFMFFCVCMPSSLVKRMKYTPYSFFLQKYFEGRVQKLPVDAGFSCPVRDGSLSHRGCSFCNAVSFSPNVHVRSSDVEEQLQRGMDFFRRRTISYDNVSYLAYFQSGTNTYAPLSEMAPLIEAALAVSGVKGVVLATRPDCLSGEWLDYLQWLSSRCFVLVEIGVESVDNDVLRRVGRGHTVEDSERAIHRLRERHLPICLHFILGLPHESREGMLAQVAFANHNGVDVIKLHQLQILRGSTMAQEYLACPERFHLFQMDEYVSFVADFLERLSPTIAVERFVSQSPSDQLLAPRWGVKNDQVTLALQKELDRRGVVQGCRYL